MKYHILTAEKDENMIYHCSYAQNLSSCEITCKACKKFRPERDSNPMFSSSTIKVHIALPMQAIWEMVSM